MADTWRALLDNDAILAMAGYESFARGLVYARSGHVLGVRYDPETRVVSGQVRGSGRDVYSTVVRLHSNNPGAVPVHRGHCTCPVALDCKHAAAVLVVARTIDQIQQQLDRAPWERILGRVVAAPDPVSPADRVPLALELEVQTYPGGRGMPGRKELRARPLQRGRSGKWVRSGVSWDELELSSGLHRPEQREWLLQLRSAAGPAARYTYPRTPWMNLNVVGGSLWPLLDAAARINLVLVCPGPRQPAVTVEHEPAVVELDVDRDPDGGLRLTPVVRLGDLQLAVEAIGLLGEPAHGLFLQRDLRGTRSASASPLSLVRLASPVAQELRQLVLNADPVRIPAADENRFLSDFYPGLQRKASLVSHDPSVQLPAYVPPTLHLQVTFRPEHRVRLDWSFRYARPTGIQSFELDAPADRRTVRDPAAERALLAELPLPYPRMPHLAADHGGGGPASGSVLPAAHALLAGHDAVLFTQELLPQLTAAGVEVELVGQMPDYRLAEEKPLVELSTIDDGGGADWFDLHITVSVEGEVVPFDRLFVALSRGDDYLILDSGVYLELDREEFTRLRTLIEEARALQEGESTPQLRISTYQASLWEELLQLGVVIEQADRWSKTVAGLMDATSVEPVEVPSTLQARLRPYQVEGYRWLSFLYEHGLGGILADDMGLGKTLQALALICRRVLDEPDGAPFLVVAPTSVVPNWGSEAARFAPRLRIVTVDRSQAKSRQHLAETIAGADLVITSYTLLRIDFDGYQSIEWAGMILDEAQFVKNHRAKTYQCARRLDAGFKLAITGTPLENSLMDLWALLSIVAPGLFPHPGRFSDLYRKPIERGEGADLLPQLRRRIRPLMLRRTKELVAADLPAKQEQVLDVVLEPKHLRLYQTYLQRERQKVLGLLDDVDANRFTILGSLTRLRQLSLDPSLVDEAHAGVPASKVEVLVEQLAEVVQEGHKALVFSQFTGFLAKIRQRLEAEGVRYLYLDGSTRRRGALVEEFRSGAAPVFLISLKAGGFGLNLTEADYCYVLDPWWNPAAEAQAVDRTHRIGQTKTVMVYRLVAQGTIEEKVMELKARKSKLFDSMMGDEALAGGSLTAEEIRGLLG
ncbi:MAG TPA: DEAD/DEAH box helicase [Propionibacteriaceae bacterium]|nr:DEAD/DEAH box helicase [Propionibacteriaceae bacterium]